MYTFCSIVQNPFLANNKEVSNPIPVELSLTTAISAFSF